MISMEVLSQMVSSLAGKNSLGKLVQYVIRLAVYYSHRRQVSWAQRSFKAIRSSGAFAKIVSVVLGCEIQVLRSFVDPLSGVADGISLFRQSLRFGKTPFRVKSLVRDSVKVAKRHEYGEFSSDRYIVSVIDTLYGVVDEIGLLFKFGYYNSKKTPRFKKIIGKADEVIWMADILMQLKTGVTELQVLEERKRYIVNHDTENEKVSLDEYLKELEEVNDKIYVVKLGLMKSMFDFWFDLIDLGSLNVSRYLYYLMGAMSGLMNTLKVYHGFARGI